MTLPYSITNKIKIFNEDYSMNALQNKIDFAVVFQVKNANPNGDPLNGNRPRIDYDGYGEVSDVCIKRKIRDRMQELGQAIFVQSDDRRTDEHKTLKDRAKAALGENLSADDTADKACKTWLDVRAFGQIFAFAGSKKTSKKNNKGAAKSAQVSADEGELTDERGISIPIRGPVSLQTAVSIAPINIDSMQITKSVSSEGDGSKRGSDTMGMKHRVKTSAIYAFYGAINPQLAERTGFSDQDADVIKTILPRLFENDASSARPEGTMRILNVFWWKHNCKAGQYSSAKVHGSLKIETDGSTTVQPLSGLEPEVIEGF